MTVAIESAFEVSQTTRNRIYSIFNRQFLISAFVIIITNGIENVTVFRIKVANMDISNEFYDFACKAILGLTIHAANDCTKTCKLVSVCDDVIGSCFAINRGYCVGIPRIIAVAFPLCRFCNHCNLGEGLEIKNYITRGRVVFIVVVLGNCTVFQQSHSNRLPVFNVVEAIVAHIQTYGQKFFNANRHYNIVILCNSINVNIDRKRSFGFTQRNVCLAVCNIAHI